MTQQSFRNFQLIILESTQGQLKRNTRLAFVCDTKIVKIVIPAKLFLRVQHIRMWSVLWAGGQTPTEQMWISLSNDKENKQYSDCQKHKTTGHLHRTVCRVFDMIPPTYLNKRKFKIPGFAFPRQHLDKSTAILSGCKRCMID